MRHSKLYMACLTGTACEASDACDRPVAPHLVEFVKGHPSGPQVDVRPGAKVKYELVLLGVSHLNKETGCQLHKDSRQAGRVGASSNKQP